MKKKPSNEKVFIIQKRVTAASAAAALRKEKTIDADEVYLEKRRPSGSKGGPDLIGFSIERDESDDNDDE